MTNLSLPVGWHLMYFAHLRLLSFFHPCGWRIPLTMKDLTAAFSWNGQQDWTNFWLFKNRRLSTHFDIALPLSNSWGFHNWQPHFWHPLSSFTHSQLCFENPQFLQRLFFVSRGFRISHSSVMQISKSYDIVPSLYSRFSFYSHHGVP